MSALPYVNAMDSGSSESFELGPNDFATVVNGTVIGAAGNTVVTSAQTFGPYPQGATLRVVAADGCSVSITQPDASRVTYSVANLPAGTLGQREFVTDALSPAFAAAPVGGGAVVSPVYFDGSIWRVG